MWNRAVRTLVAQLLLLPAAPALACSLCSAGDPLIAASDAPSRAGELRFSLEGSWQEAEAASEADPTTRERLTQREVRLLAVYGPTERVNVVAALPWLWKELGPAGGGPGERMDRDGLGDAELGARWFAWRRTDWGWARRQGVAFSAGTSLPTGTADASEAGVRLEDHAQLGTGGWGPYAGVLYRLEQLHWDAFASVTGRWRTENRWGFRFGPSVTWTLQGQWQPLDRLAVGLGLDGRQAAPDEEDGVVVEHTGGFLLAAAPAIYLGATDDLWISVRAQLPVATSLRGDQRVGPVVVAGIQWIAH